MQRYSVVYITYTYLYRIQVLENKYLLKSNNIGVKEKKAQYVGQWTASGQTRRFSRPSQEKCNYIVESNITKNVHFSSTTIIRDSYKLVYCSLLIYIVESNLTTKPRFYNLTF